MLKNDTIHLGNTYELIKEIEDQSIDCIYTDIPYLLSKNTGSGKDKISKSMQKVASEIAYISDGIDYKILDDFVRIMKKINCFIWCSTKQIRPLIDYFEKKGCYYEILVWCKTNPIPACNRTWLNDIEYCLYFREKGVVLNHGYQLKSKFYFSATNKADKLLFKHPTIKPLELVKRHLLHATQTGDIVFDGFSGAGTTCKACQEIDRHYLGIELEEKWHKISVDRLNGFDSEGKEIGGD